jgi:hypothetical protein
MENAADAMNIVAYHIIARGAHDSSYLILSVRLYPASIPVLDLLSCNKSYELFLRLLETVINKHILPLT